MSHVPCEFEDLIEATKAEQCQCLVHGIVRQLAEVATGLGGGGALAIVGRGEEQHVQVVDGAVGEPLPVPRLAVRLQGLDVGEGLSRLMRLASVVTFDSEACCTSHLSLSLPLSSLSLPLQPSGAAN